MHLYESFRLYFSMHCVRNSSLQSLRWICGRCCCCCFVLLNDTLNVSLNIRRCMNTYYAHIINSNVSHEMQPREYKVTSAVMKWHSVSSAIWKWVFKIKRITIEIIVSILRTPLFRHPAIPMSILFFVLVLLTLNIHHPYWEHRRTYE